MSLDLGLPRQSLGTKTSRLRNNSKSARFTIY